MNRIRPNFSDKIILRIIILKIRAAALSSGPPLYHISVRLSIGNLYKNLVWFLVKMHKKSRSIERDFVRFAYRHFDGFGFLFAIKSVISDKLAYALVLPSLAGLILISQGVILGKRKRKVIDELTARRHGVIGTFLVVAVMFLAAALKVIGSAYLENEITVPVDIMTDI